MAQRPRSALVVCSGCPLSTSEAVEAGAERERRRMSFFTCPGGAPPRFRAAFGILLLVLGRRKGHLATRHGESLLLCRPQCALETGFVALVQVQVLQTVHEQKFPMYLIKAGAGGLTYIQAGKRKKCMEKSQFKWLHGLC